jgi:hypothetical protein
MEIIFYHTNHCLYTYYYNATASDRVQVTNVISDCTTSYNLLYVLIFFYIDLIVFFALNFTFKSIVSLRFFFTFEYFKFIC